MTTTRQLKNLSSNSGNHNNPHANGTNATHLRMQKEMARRAQAKNDFSLTK
jgi:hypothetical protein